MAGISLISRAFNTIHNVDVERKNEMIENLIHHLELLEKKNGELERKNKRLERKYWEIKIKYEEEEN